MLKSEAEQRLRRELDRVTASVVALDQAEREYRSALLAALDAGAGYTLTGKAAGMSKQAVYAFAIANWQPARMRLARRPAYD